MERAIIIGAGLAGLSAAIQLAESGRPALLVSAQQSERAQSVLAEGGINAALDTMGEGDSASQHYEDTLRGGAYLADPNAVAGLVRHAPEIVRALSELGVPFNLTADEDIMLRPFGGQKKRRTAYAQSSTGKMIMTALIDRARSFESAGLIKRLPHHELLRLLISDARCVGVRVRDVFSGRLADIRGSVIMCCGGMNGVFPGMTTGTTANTGDAAAALFSQGVRFAGLEMLQYHPTTIGIPGKRCLITEAARGEGGRLWIKKQNGQRFFFMEEKYPELGNLMPRDVVSREMYFVRRLADTEGEVLLDMTGLGKEVWSSRLSDMRDEIMSFTGLDPAKTPIEVHEGIHYFMGGIHTDEQHRTSLSGLYAAGECACQYHGANRLGGNSMLGAIYGGRVAAAALMSDQPEVGEEQPIRFSLRNDEDPLSQECRGDFEQALCRVLLGGLGIVRSGELINAALEGLDELEKRGLSPREKNKLRLGRAMLLSALERRESRGAHFREDFPKTDDSQHSTVTAQIIGGEITLGRFEIPVRRAEPEHERS